MWKTLMTSSKASRVTSCIWTMATPLLWATTLRDTTCCSWWEDETSSGLHSPPRLRMEPEVLLRDFIDVTGLKIQRLHRDNKFTASTSFTVFCKLQGIVL